MENKRKGFTLVELLVVIAILAVLASVSVVGYISFTKKANLSNDQTMIKMINDNLMGESIFEEPKSASEAIVDLYTQGFNSEKIKPFSKNHHYAYSLENNKFYLLDENDDVIFPNENVDKAKLWGLYRNSQQDAINGVTNYVAMEAIHDQQKFDAVFTSANYTIDLNHNFALVTGKPNVKLMNGSVKSGSGFTVDTNSEVVELQNFTGTTNLSLTNKGMYFKDNNFVDKYPVADETKDLIFKGCLFDGLSSPQLDKSGKYRNIIFEDCTFINSTHWTLTLGAYGRGNSYIIRNNKFISCARGINFNGAVSPNNIIEGNEFILANDNKANVIQIADLFKDHEASINNFAPCFTIKNNVVKTANAFVVVHSRNVRQDSTTLIDAAVLDKYVKFENNRLLDSNIAKVVPDPDAEKDLAGIENGIATLQVYVDKVLSLVK